jgi:hypothetical protein
LLVDAAGEHAAGCDLGQQLVGLALLVERLVQEPVGIVVAKLVGQRASRPVARDLVVLDPLGSRD